MAEEKRLRRGAPAAGANAASGPLARAQRNCRTPFSVPTAAASAASAGGATSKQASTHRASSYRAPPARTACASGRTPQGEPVQAQLVWLQSGNTLFHLALYAPRIRAEMQEPFLSAVQLP